jgi:hypothetical protein
VHINTQQTLNLHQFQLTYSLACFWKYITGNTVYLSSETNLWLYTIWISQLWNKQMGHWADNGWVIPSVLKNHGAIKMVGTTHPTQHRIPKTWMLSNTAVRSSNPKMNNYYCYPLLRNCRNVTTENLTCVITVIVTNLTMFRGPKNQLHFKCIHMRKTNILKSERL